jgi:hypothetical protein
MQCEEKNQHLPKWWYDHKWSLLLERTKSQMKLDSEIQSTNEEAMELKLWER